MNDFDLWASLKPARFQIVTLPSNEVLLLDTAGGTSLRLDATNWAWNQLPMNFLPQTDSAGSDPTATVA